MFEEFVNVDHILKPEVAYWYLSFKCFHELSRTIIITLTKLIISKWTVSNPTKIKLVRFWDFKWLGWVYILLLLYHNNLNTFAHSAAAVEEEEEAVQESFRSLEQLNMCPKLGRDSWAVSLSPNFNLEFEVFSLYMSVAAAFRIHTKHPTLVLVGLSEHHWGDVSIDAKEKLAWHIKPKF